VEIGVWAGVNAEEAAGTIAVPLSFTFAGVGKWLKRGAEGGPEEGKILASPISLADVRAGPREGVGEDETGWYGARVGANRIAKSLLKIGRRYAKRGSLFMSGY